MSALNSILNILRDPPPEFAFEISASGIALSRTSPPAAIQFAALKPGVVVPSPVKENILDPLAFVEAVKKLVPPSNRGGRRGAALILPDNSVRIAVLDFDTLPDKEEERRSLISFRLRKSVPFDVDEAALSYVVQGRSVVVALAPSEILAHYEAPFRVAGLHPGLVTVSSLAMLEMLPSAGSLLVAHRSPGVLTVFAVSDGVITLSRTLELTPDPIDPLEEISATLYPTIAFVEDRNGTRPEKLLIAGFGSDSVTSATRLSIELELPVEPIVAEYPGLMGYLSSLSPELAGQVIKSDPAKRAAA